MAHGVAKFLGLTTKRSDRVHWKRGGVQWESQLHTLSLHSSTERGALSGKDEHTHKRARGSGVGLQGSTGLGFGET
jgi:hypothetical protein